MININGAIFNRENASIDPANRGLNYGDAVFETLKYSAGKILFWEDHYFRLMASMRIMRMEIPMSFTPEFLQDEVQRIIENCTDQTFRIKILVWRESEGKYTPKSNGVSYMITSEKIDEPFYILDESHYEVELFKDHYVNSGLLSTIKSNNRAINVLGSIFAKENDYQNCLLINENKQIIEALHGNIFLVNGYKIKTPPLTDGCLNGIIRKQVISIIGQMPDYILDESSVSPFELQKADEIFVTNTIIGIRPISKYRKKEFANIVAKDILAKLNVKARLG